jgi:hypothetical protein
MTLPVIYTPAPGPDDYKVLRERGYYYVDKTAFIAEVLQNPGQVLLLPRPRRFGKSLNLSTLRYYLEKTDEDRSALFEGLAITQASAEVQAHQGRYPVIFLGLKDARSTEWEICRDALRGCLHEALRPHADLRHSPALSEEDRHQLESLLAGRASQGELESCLRRLTGWLHAHHGVPAVLLIDEYDAPIEAGYTNGYSHEVLDFIRNLLGGALKSNPHLYRGVLTGVRRVSKESLFSGLNNVRVCSVLDTDFASAFGFIEPEVAAVLDAAGRSAHLDEVRAWYNGYVFGGQTIYNPWSVLSFAEQGIIKEYWVSTSSEELLRQLIPANKAGLQGPFEALFHGETVEKVIDEHVVLRDLQTNPDAIWSFMLTAGYLKAVDVRWEEGQPRVKLAIPNREVMGVWRRQFVAWLSMGFGGAPLDVQALIDALLRGDARIVQRLLRILVANVLSYHDTAMGPDDPERVYQAFVVGLLCWMEPRWRVRSNRESGYGRADVLIIPSEPGRPGVVLETKRLWRDEGETPEGALDAAHAQMVERGYAAELEAVGASAVHRLAVVFDGKMVWVR